MQVLSLRGRRVEIRGLTSPQGLKLNGQVGGVIADLEAGRWGVRLEGGDKSIHERNLRVRPLSDKEMCGLDGLDIEEETRKWPAEVVSYFHTHREQYYTGSDPEEVAVRIDCDFEYEAFYGNLGPPRFSPLLGLCDVGDGCVSNLLKSGLSLEYILKVLLRRLAGFRVDAPNALDGKGDGSLKSPELTRLLKVAHVVGRDSDLVSDFDSADLLHAVLAADRVGSTCLVAARWATRSRAVLSPLSTLAATLFRCGVSVRGHAEEAKSKFRDLCADLGNQTAANWLRSQLNEDRFNQRVDEWCAWEERQWCLTMRTCKGLMPPPAAARVATFIAGPPAPASLAVHGEMLHAVQVVQEVFHSEPTPQIDEEVAHTAAQLEADERWAESTEHRLRSEPVAPHEAGSGPFVAADVPLEQSEQVFKLRVGGNNIEGLRQRLLTGPEFAPCRRALESDSPQSRSFELPEKALVFVKPWQYDSVRQALVGVELHYFHIIISESFEYLLEEALQTFPCRQRAKVKQQHRQALALDVLSGEAAPAVEEAPAVLPDLPPIIAARTFLCEAPLRTAANQVAQSTTEAVGESSLHYSRYRGENPRRVVAVWP